MQNRTIASPATESVLLFLLLHYACASAENLTLSGHGWRIQIDPATLRTEALLQAEGSLLISEGLQKAVEVSALTSSENQATWRLPERHLDVSVRMRPDSCQFDFKASQPSDLNWPRLITNPDTRALILPHYEGSYVPLNDLEWREHLVHQEDLALAEALSMPFFGFQVGRSTITLIFSTPFNNEFRYLSRDSSLVIELTHRFTRLDSAGDYSVLVRVGPDSPIEPARQYRRWLIEEKRFVSMAEKIRAVPRAERLLGAVHAYLWNGGYLHHTDVQDWPGFCLKLQQQPASPASSPAQHIMALLSSEAREAVDALASSNGGRHAQQAVTRELNALLDSAKLFDSNAWATIRLSENLRQALASGLADQPIAVRCAVNAELLVSAFPPHFQNPTAWGDGISSKLLNQLHQAGLDRACLTLHDLTPGNRRPDLARLADKLGYLYGPYDSYHSIHSPTEQDTWETAQFDTEAYEKGAVVRANGQKWPGFQKKGFRFSALAARPYVELRVNGLMNIAPFTSWFVDCDATGECSDNFSPFFPATQAQDFAVRLDRMQWISKTRKVPVGSETGSGLAAAVIHFAHGMMTPVIGWGDSDLKDRRSPYWLGAYYPPEAPTVFFKPVPLKPAYYKFYFDPRYRLPLYQIAFHDSVATSHHWSAPSFKFSDQQQQVALLEQLYNVPPLYHFNLDEWAKNKDLILRHYQFFSPLHRQLGLQAMTDFQWLSTDHLVQQTVFADGTQIFANFGQKSIRPPGLGFDLPPESVVAKRPDGAMVRFSPSLPSPR